MRTIISPNGYFYKKYKNGKKKRISKKEYIKLNLKGGSNSPVSNIPLKKNLHPNLGTLNRLLVTEYIETQVHPNIRNILLKSKFYNECMKPLLDLKKVKIKIKKTGNNITTFSTIREPIFTNKPGQNFQDRLFDWWNEVSDNFNKTAKDYVLMKKVSLELINETGEHSSDYFYLQLPVVFINRILQMLQYYNEMSLLNFSKTNVKKSELFKNQKEINQNTGLNFVNYYTKNKSNEPKLQNAYNPTKSSLKTFRTLFEKLDIFWDNDGLYTKLFEVEKASLEWYSANVWIKKSLKTTEDTEFLKFNQNSKNYNKALLTYFEASYDKKYCIMPTSIDPAEEYMLNMFTIPIIIYLSKLKPVHKIRETNTTGLLAHPLLQLDHDFRHMIPYIYEYYELSTFESIDISRYFKFRQEFFKIILSTQYKKLIDFMFGILHESGAVILTSLLKCVRVVGSFSYMFDRFSKLYISRNEFETLCNNNNIPILQINSLNPLIFYSVLKHLFEMHEIFTISIDGNTYEKSLINDITKAIETSFRIAYQSDIAKLNIKTNTNNTNDKDKIFLVKKTYPYQNKPFIIDNILYKYVYKQNGYRNYTDPFKLINFKNIFS